ncbi:hypothetical protein I3842_15G161200 [Carya illinoinensis]|uniref:WD repeat-containing protein 76 n=1 Tax=Carya illinoinensis TaxID=32201 RepID=A0A922A8B5_CARIL|nr:hypothetical protein I3842_15G161200 [Carya illinoinensis]
MESSQQLTEYELKRLDNIRRNDQLMASLKIHSKVAELSAASKRQRVGIKSYKVSPEKKPKTEAPIVIRRSLRTRGMPPDHSDSKGLSDIVEATDKVVKSPTSSKPSPRALGPLSVRDASRGTGSDKSLIERIMEVSKKEDKKFGDKNGGDLMEGVRESGSCLELESLSLNPENIARVVPGRILNVRFFPCSDRRIIVVGNKFGNVGFWDVDSGVQEEDGVYLYHPHPGPVSGISIHKHSLPKIFTSCYDGFIRLMDAEKEVFDLVYSTEDTIYSLSQRSDDVKCLYFSEGPGGLNIWDDRVGKCSAQWNLHESRINTIDFNSENFNIMATSSSDGTACIWDLRSIGADKPKSLKEVRHKRAVHSAYFSPSGCSLATTSMDDTVGILSGANFDDNSMIKHYNQTGRWISSFRAIWGWDDSYVFIGNMKRGVDVISPAQRRTIFTLQSPHMSAIPCRFDAHPYNVGVLAGATSGGQVYMWTSS